MRRAVAAFAAGLLLAVTLPATATHPEPSAPVTGLSLRLGQYPFGDTELACDGSDVVSFDKLRVEMILAVAATPSEHWSTRIEMAHSVAGSGGNWDILWPHQNVGPHNPRRNNHTGQIAQNLEPGEWSVRVVVTGDASGVVLEESCSFVAD